MDERVAAVLWRLTLLAIGFAAYAASVATARAQLPGQLQGLVTWAARVKLAIYAIAAISSGAFSVAIVDYSLSFGFVLAAHCWTWARTRDKAALTVISGVVVSFLAAAIQAVGIAPHEYFNHNDLYHVVQMLGTGLLYRGALHSARPGP